MGQLINIPALNGPIQVDLGVTLFGVGNKRLFVDFPDDADPYDASMKLPQGDQNANLVVQAMLGFPPQDGEGHTVWYNMYHQNVRALFPMIVKDGVVQILATEKALQGEPNRPGAQQNSPFRFIEGKAWLTATQNPRFYAVKVTMMLGTLDGKELSWSTTEEKASWSFGIEVGGGDKAEAKQAGIVDKAGMVIDIIKKLVPTLSAGRSGGKTTETKGGSRTVGQLTQTREWTLLLEVPEPKKPPQPVVYREGPMHPVYFDTNKKEIGKYLEPKSKTDQLKDLIRWADAQIEKYGVENITKVTVSGHASRLGDTEANVNLSEARAKHVADFLKRFYKMKIPDDHITFRGEPVDEGSDRDNSWKDRVVWVTIHAVRIVKP